MTGNPSIDKIILGLNGIAVIAATTLVVYSHNGIKKPATNQGAEFGTAIENQVRELQKPPVSMNEIVVNLYSRERRLRFLNTKMNLVLFKEDDRKEAMELKAYINDTLIDIAGNMKPEELNTITGKILLESRIKTKVNEYAGRAIIRKIFFSKFIIQ